MSNKLYHVKDAVSPNLYDNDFENATGFNASSPSVNNNYQYDANGNLATDVVEQIQEIQWNSIGKIKAIIRTSGSIKPDIEYGYRADGQRLYKLVKPKESNGALKQELNWMYTYYVRDLEGNVMATYEKTMESTTTANTYKEKYNASAWDLFGSSRLGVLSEKNNLISTREFIKFGTTNTGSWVDRTYTGAATLTTINAVIHIITRGNKQFELCNHLGNVLVTVQDRKRSVDVNADNQADYYLPYLRTVSNYYAYGSAMPGIGGSIKECTVTSTNLTLKKYPYFYTFSNDSTSGFTAGSGARSVTNPTHNVLHLESIWTTRPLANKSIYLKNGVNYALKFNLTGFSVVSGYTHTVKVRILLPGNTLSYTYTATGNQTINFTSNTTGNVTVEISSQITGSGTYSVNPYIDIDNFNLSWDSTYTAYVNNCGSNAENYKYGFNTQEKDNEIAGENNFYTAEFWEYDARIARRWNVDPVFKEFESPYACFGGNSIYYNDIKGDDKNSRHLDADGKIIAEYKDDDDKVYKHQTARTKEDVDKWRDKYNNTSGNGILVGYINCLDKDGIFSWNPSKEYYSKNRHKVSIEARKRVEKADPQIKQAQVFGGINWSGVNTGLNVADGFGVLAAAGREIALDYRMSQPLMNKVGMSGNVKAISGLGTASKYLGAAGHVAAILGTVLDYNQMKNGQMSSARFGYNTTGTTVGIGVGIGVGAVPGAAAGGAFYIGQQMYDGYNWWAGQMSIYLTNIENGLKSGWFPGR